MTSRLGSKMIWVLYTENELLTVKEKLQFSLESIDNIVRFLLRADDHIDEDLSFLLLLYNANADIYWGNESFTNSSFSHLRHPG